MLTIYSACFARRRISLNRPPDEAPTESEHSRVHRRLRHARRRQCASPRVPGFVDLPGYARHRPETTLLYQLVAQHYPAFRELRAMAGRPLPDYIAERIGRMLEKRGLIERDCENAWLSSDMVPAGPLDHLVGHAITYRIAVGPRAGQKVFTLQTVPAQSEGEGHNGAAVMRKASAI